MKQEEISCIDQHFLAFCHITFRKSKLYVFICHTSSSRNNSKHIIYKGRIRKFMGVWELENQIKFSIKYSVNSLINAALEKPKHPPPRNASESVSYLPELCFRPGGFAPMDPLPGLCPGPTGGLGGPQTPCLLCFHIVQGLATPLVHVHRRE